MSSQSAIRDNLRGYVWRLALVLAPIILISVNSEKFIHSIASPYILASWEALRGGSILGFRYAYVGGLLLTCSQLYLLVKYGVVRMGEKAVLSRWLWLHCSLASAGGLLLILHAGIPFSFQYFDPISRLMVWAGLPTLTAVRGPLTWLLILTGITGFMLRHMGMRPGSRRITWMLHVGLAASTYITGLIHIYISTFMPSAR